MEEEIYILFLLRCNYFVPIVFAHRPLCPKHGELFVCCRKFTDSTNGNRCAPMNMNVLTMRTYFHCMWFDVNESKSCPSGDGTWEKQHDAAQTMTTAATEARKINRINKNEAHLRFESSNTPIAISNNEMRNAVVSLLLCGCSFPRYFFFSRREKKINRKRIVFSLFRFQSHTKTFKEQIWRVIITCNFYIMPLLTRLRFSFRCAHRMCD